MLHPTSNAFTTESSKAIQDPQLQEALSVLRVQSIPNRLRAAANMPEFEALRDRARDLKDHILGHLDQYLLQFEEQVKLSGGQVHWCSDAEAAAPDHPEALPRGERQDGHQGQDHDRRGDRQSTISWRRTASSRSRPTSANTLSSSATRFRATLSARLCM